MWRLEELKEHFAPTVRDHHNGHVADCLAVLSKLEFRIGGNKGLGSKSPGGASSRMGTPRVQTVVITHIFLGAIA